MNEIALGPEEYLASLRMGEDEASMVTGLDGAELWRIADEHFVVFSCAEHTHKGPALLRRVIPAEWVVFYEATNTDEGFTVTHYGPDLETP